MEAGPVRCAPSLKEGAKARRAAARSALLVTRANEPPASLGTEQSAKRRLRSPDGPVLLTTGPRFPIDSRSFAERDPGFQDSETFIGDQICRISEFQQTQISEITLP